ncbi:hypothetical protein BDZ45DRAFT_748389 [Acephala macrosclerotiorum]|nr:hypothetical protein BDZ45DRAFT_748389 [Acephala macrosclerotiorum]
MYVKEPAKPEDIKGFGDALSRIRSSIYSLGADHSEELADESTTDDTVKLLLRSMRSRSSGYDLAIAEGRFMAMVPSTAQRGDVIVVLYGSKIPHVLRPVAGGEEGTFELVGMAYVHGYMYGAAIEQRDAGVLKEKAFVLV